MAAEGLAAAVLVLGVLLGGWALATAAAEVPDLWDPCRTWGMRNGGTLSPDQGCPSRSGTSETKPEFLLRLTAIQGGCLVASLLSAWGSRRRDRTAQGLLAVAAAIAAVESALLFVGLSFLFVLTALLAVLAGVLLVRLRPAEPSPLPAA